jgi:hypothetical protein
LRSRWASVTSVFRLKRELELTPEIFRAGLGRSDDSVRNPIVSRPPSLMVPLVVLQYPVVCGPVWYDFENSRLNLQTESVTLESV